MWRQARFVPLADPAAEALARLGLREHYTTRPGLRVRLEARSAHRPSSSAQTLQEGRRGGRGPAKPVALSRCATAPDRSSHERPTRGGCKASLGHSKLATTERVPARKTATRRRRAAQPCVRRSDSDSVDRDGRDVTTRSWPRSRSRHPAGPESGDQSFPLVADVATVSERQPGRRRVRCQATAVALVGGTARPPDRGALLSRSGRSPSAW